MRKKGLKVLFLMMALALIIVGCGTKENAKEENAKKSQVKINLLKSQQVHQKVVVIHH